MEKSEAASFDAIKIFGEIFHWQLSRKRNRDESIGQKMPKNQAAIAQKRRYRSSMPPVSLELYDIGYII